MATDYNDSPFKQYCEPSFDIYYLDIDEQTHEEIKLYTYIKKEEFQKKIPSHYRYLYVLRKEVYELNDTVIFHKAENCMLQIKTPKTGEINQISGISKGYIFTP